MKHEYVKFYWSELRRWGCVNEAIESTIVKMRADQQEDLLIQEFTSWQCKEVERDLEENERKT